MGMSVTKVREREMGESTFESVMKYSNDLTFKDNRNRMVQIIGSGNMWDAYLGLMNVQDKHNTEYLLHGHKIDRSSRLAEYPTYSVDGKFCRGNGEMWLYFLKAFITSRDLLTNADVDTMSKICRAMVESDQAEIRLGYANEDLVHVHIMDAEEEILRVRDKYNKIIGNLNILSTEIMESVRSV